MATWIDFRELRQKLRFADVLRHYHVEPKIKGDRAYALCPLPQHPARTDGKKRTASLSVHLRKGIFQCFGCKTSGNAVEFVARMEGLDPADPAEFRQAAIKAADMFGISAAGDHRPSSDAQDGRSKSCPPKKGGDPAEKDATTILVNAPLDFELKHLDPAHPYLGSRGFTPESIAHFGLGYCAKGMMADRIAIPLHDAAGSLIGYAGRLVDSNKISDENPKYRFPGTRERNGVTHEFHKSRFLYAGHRIERPVKDLVVVEGFAGVWWLWQHGYRHVVALMGASCSPEQATLIVASVTTHGRVWVMPDGNDAGERCAVSVLTNVAPERFVRWVKLVKNQQPTDLSLLELGALLPMHSAAAKKKRARKTAAADSAPASGSAIV